MALTDISPAMRIDVYTHNVKISKFTQAGKHALLEYCRGLAQFGYVRVGRHVERQMLRVYVGVTRDRSEFRFHRNQLEDLLRHLGKWGFASNMIQIVEHPVYEPVKVDFPLKDTRPPREEQVPIINYLVEPPKEGYAPSKAVTLQTGKGKTFLSLNAIHQIGQRTVLVVKGMYVEKWIGDVEAAYHTKPGDVMVVRGAKHLRALLQLGLDGKLEAKFIIISLTTMRNYLDEYEQYHNSELFPYPVRPDQFYETLGVGIRLIDEVHQDFHAVYRFDLYSHVPKSISLSATLDSDDRFINRMYETIWPLGTRAPEIAYHKYIVMKCLWYSLNNPRKIRCQNFMKQYSHVMFEQSLMKDQQALKSYLDMITGIVTESYIRVRQEGQKMLIFCSTIELCTILRNHLARLMPSLTINRYVGEDEYDALLNADICVSTLLSAGTAVDIPNLRITLMTTALSSKQANIQMLGRTRPLKDWPDVTPECLFLAAREIEKHVKYAKEKSEKLDGKVLSYKEMQTPFRV